MLKATDEGNPSREENEVYGYSEEEPPVINNSGEPPVISTGGEN
ncbi:MAG TPA: hypothetical protein VGB17_12700 [Pyrinomonadaceae bacterium]|jgi:hypothetical protein